MKKILVLPLIILIAIAASWIYCANQFEKTVKQNILPFIQQNNKFVQVDNANINISKYMFKVTFKDVTIDCNTLIQRVKSNIPDLPVLTAYSDQIELYSYPFSKIVNIKFNGDKTTVGAGETQLYANKPSIKYSFNKELLQGDYTNIQINIDHNNTYLSSTSNQPVMNTGKGSYVINGQLINDRYNVSIKNDVNGYIVSDKAFVEKASSEVENIIIDTFDLNKEQVSKKMLSNLYDSATSYKSNISFSLSQKQINALYSMLTNTGDNNIIASYINLIAEQIKLTADTDVVNKNITYSFNSNIEYNIDHIIYDLGINIKPSFSDELKNTLILDIVNIVNDDNTYQPTKDNITKIASYFINAENFAFSTKNKLDIQTKTINSNSNLEYNDLVIKNEGTLNFGTKLIDTKLSINTPKKLMNRIIDFYNNGLNDSSKIMFTPFIKQIKQAGPSVFEALHNNDTLKDEETFISNVIYNYQDNKWSINNKDIHTIIEDPRIKNFISDGQQDN